LSSATGVLKRSLGEILFSSDAGFASKLSLGEFSWSDSDLISATISSIEVENLNDRLFLVGEGTIVSSSFLLPKRPVEAAAQAYD